MRYSKERKEAVLRKMMPPQSRSIVALAKQEGIGEATLYNWRCKARNRGLLLPDGDVGCEGWSARDKFNAVIESAALGGGPQNLDGVLSSDSDPNGRIRDEQET